MSVAVKFTFMDINHFEKLLFIKQVSDILIALITDLIPSRVELQTANILVLGTKQIPKLFLHGRFLGIIN